MTEPENICDDPSVLFEKARQLEDAERQAYLDLACQGKPALRSNIESMLDAYAEQGEFLADPTVDVQPRELASIGSMIGPYKLLQKLGEGGMGVVYMAEQTDPIKMRVALKIIKPGMDSKQVIARFESERQALALMDHPNIAKVVAAGTTDSGHPYFAMELVKGERINTYCDKHRLTLRERMRLFHSVCSAVQHAHQKGIIHRDLKPSNVLVARYDGHAVPKIIDFGVAKAMGHQLTEKTLFTRYGQIVGTLEYMSPEQVEFNQVDVDTRSDIYSLGILFYELLTGTTPFDAERFRSGAWDEIVRIIRDEEPPRPSVRISTDQGEPQFAAQYRGTDPSRFLASLRGELDWLAMKALAKERDRRYQTASAFAEDVERYLNGEAIEARPPSTVYRLRKTARRHRYALATAAIVMVALLGITGVSTWSAIRLGHETRNSVAARREAETAMQLAEREGEKAERALAYVRDYTMLMVMSGREEDLQKALEIAARAEASPAWQRMLRARSALHRGDLDSAIALLEQGLRVTPGDLACQGLLLYVRIWQGYANGMGEAIKAYYESVNSKKELSFEEMVFAGEASLLDTTKGIAWIDKALERRDSDLARLVRSEMLARHAIEFNDTRRLATAIEDINRVLESFPNSPYIIGESLKVHTLAMQALRQNGETYAHLQMSAEDLWRRLCEIPHYKAGKLWRAWYCDNFKPGHAQETWLEVLEGGCSGWHKTHAANVCMGRVINGNVRSFFDETEILERFGFVGALFFQGREEEARDICEQHPHDGGPIFWVFGTHLDPLLVVGSAADVQTEAKRLLADEDQEFITAFDRTLTKLLAGEATVEQVEKDCRNNSDRTMLHFAVARLRILQGRWDEVKAHLQEAVDLGVIHVSDYYWAKRYLVHYADHFED